MIEIFHPDKVDCLPDKRIFLARAGARYGKIDEDFIHRVNELFLMALEKIKPIVYYRTCDASALPKEVIPTTFGSIRKMTIFLSTLGSTMDELISQLIERGSTFDGFIVDSWASEALETLNERFHLMLRERFGEGTMRFSPGYGSVDLRVNRYIVKEFLKVDQVTVLESGVMIPRKTTTCMVGWFDDQK